jgi:hypothetical protein
MIEQVRLRRQRRQIMISDARLDRRDPTGSPPGQIEADYQTKSTRFARMIPRGAIRREGRDETMFEVFTAVVS